LLNLAVTEVTGRAGSPQLITESRCSLAQFPAISDSSDVQRQTVSVQR